MENLVEAILRSRNVKMKFYDHIQGSSTMALFKCPSCGKIVSANYVPKCDHIPDVGKKVEPESQEPAEKPEGVVFDNKSTIKTASS